MNLFKAIIVIAFLLYHGHHMKGQVLNYCSYLFNCLSCFSVTIVIIFLNGNTYIACLCPLLPEELNVKKASILHNITIETYSN